MWRSLPEINSTQTLHEFYLTSPMGMKNAVNMEPKTNKTLHFLFLATSLAL